MDRKVFTVALAGNPNSGKTTIFNQFTGTRQKVGNWPGVTVEKKEGRIHYAGSQIKIVDLPGTYSLTPFSIEEIVARNFILDEHPDIVIDIIDASNLERSLYLATQLRELDCKVLFALNMEDLARSRGIKINAVKLSELLDVPVVFTVGNKNRGIDTLLQSAIELAGSDFKIPQTRKVKYSHDIEAAVTELQELLEQQTTPPPYNSRWTSIKLLENDQIILERIAQTYGPSSRVILEETEKLRGHLSNRFDEDPEIVMTDERYGFIAGITREVVSASTRQRVDISRNIDLVLTNRFVGFPIFILFIWAMFQLTFSLGAYPMEWIERGIAALASFWAGVIPEGLLRELLLDGIIAGVGSVVIFLPNILILFFCIAIFEDTGYMARAAFLMDKIMHLIGLHGKSFIPMLMGFGCNVPAIMAARTLESEKDRILTILITPFMSCSARMPIYIVLAGAFFTAQAGSVIFAIYMLGILLSVLTGRLLRSTLLRGADAPFVMELPPYRVPMLKSLLIHMWDRSKMFLRKMGGIILIGSIVVWALSTFPRNMDYSIDYAAEARRLQAAHTAAMHQVTGSLATTLEARHTAALRQLARRQKAERVEKSWLGHIGKWLTPIFRPLGIEWRGSVALLSGLVAKEIVVSTMGILHAAEEGRTDALKTALAASGMTPLSALAMMAFVLLYVPCLATISAIRRESASLKWPLFSMLYSLSMAWITAFGIYQGGKLLGFS